MTGQALAERAGQAEAATRPTIAGFVEARTQDRILGWAWDPADPDARQRVVLLAGERVVARTVADLPREDLARNGIGDGAHAFAFTLEEGMRPRAALLDVAVEAPEGGLVRLPSASGGDAAPGAFVQLQRGLAALAAGQRALAKALESALGGRESQVTTLAALAEQQERIDRAVRALEIFVCRLDERLAASAAAAPARAPRGPLLLAAACGAAGAAALAWAVAPVLG